MGGDPGSSHEETPGSRQAIRLRHEQRMFPQASSTRNPGTPIAIEERLGPRRRSRSRSRARAQEARSEVRPVRGSRGARSQQEGEDDNQPGHIHSSHVVFETQRYLFCAICGTCGQYVKRAPAHRLPETASQQVGAARHSRPAARNRAWWEAHKYTSNCLPC